MAKKIVKQKAVKKDDNIFNYVIDAFVFLALCLFHLFVTDRYHNILRSKYYARESPPWTQRTVKY